MAESVPFRERTFFTYFLGLFDLEKTSFDGVRKTRSLVSRVMSGIHDYFPLFIHNFNARGNWYALSLSDVEKGFPIDFCFTNDLKTPTKSEFHHRILLDTPTYFISNKSEFYKTFEGEDFIPKFSKSTVNENGKLIVDSNKFNEEDWIVLKTDTGCLGINIVVEKYKNLHERKFTKIYEQSTISELLISKTYQGYILTNRIYFLVIKRGNTVESYMYDEFVNYRATRPLTNTDDDFLPENYKDRIISNYSDTCTDEEFFNERYVSHQNYVSLFTRVQFEEIILKLKRYLTTITKKISSHALSNGNATAFHLYGIDTIIQNNNSIKIIEINGAPSLSGRNSLYPQSQCMDYNILIGELLNTLLKDKKYGFNNFPKEKSFKKSNQGKYSDSVEPEKLFERKFIPIHQQIIQAPPKKFYICKSVAEKYPFILKGFFNEIRTPFYQRVKNPYVPPDVFYGLRDLYVNPYSSDNYYNEIVEYNISECSRNARVVNKIQGITYFLANKARMYQKLKEKFVSSYHPPSIIVKIKDKKLCSKSSRNIFSTLDELQGCSSVIIKPSNGSQGKGIAILAMDKISILKKLFEVYDEFGYDSFVISKYIDNPYLIDGRKFNIRFYVLLHLEGEELRCYILKTKIIYFAVSKYLSEELKDISCSDKIMAKHITNLQCIRYFNEKYGLKLSLKDYVQDFERFSDSLDVYEQFLTICKETINATKSEFRGINRFVKDSSCFNLLAYDTLLDECCSLHLIEVNRGADLVGLEIIMKEKMTEIFAEIFDICVDGREDLNYFQELIY